MTDIDAALEFTDKTCRSGSLAGILAAEVRRLQAVLTAVKRDCKQWERHYKELREENERLRGWIRVEGGCNNTCTRQILGEVCHGCKCGKTLPEPAP